MVARVQTAWLSDAQLVPFYLMASFLYYHCDIGLFSDSDFDLLCGRLRTRWAGIHHQHKRIVDRAALSATTGYYIRVEEYPLITQSAALCLARRCGLTS